MERQKWAKCVLKENKGRMIEMGMVVLLLVSMLVLSKNAAHLVSSWKIEEKERVVVIDAGHGGDDPGKIGVNGALEKELNLIVAKRVQKLLEANDVKVIMTRESDEGLYPKGESNKKVKDMKKRLEIMGKAKPDLVVSIHQNSYEEESIHGAQVFYYMTSEEGKQIAELFQEQLIRRVDPENHRAAKGNDSYYLLKKTPYPIVIIECGFLSNWKEAEALVTEEYQEKVAWAIHMGVLEYLNERE